MNEMQNVVSSVTLTMGMGFALEPRWPSGNTLAFNAEDPGSTPGPGVR